MPSVFEFILYLTIGLGLIWLITYLGLRRSGSKFKKEFGIDINDQNAEQMLKSRIKDTARDVSQNPTEQNITRLHLLCHAAKYKGFLRQWK